MTAEEWEERVKRVIAETMKPLVERLDIAEANAEEQRAKAEALEAELRAKHEGRRESELVDARRRFRVSIAAGLLQGTDFLRTYGSVQESQARDALQAADVLLAEAAK